MVSVPMTLTFVGTSPVQIIGLTAIGLLVWSIFSQAKYTRLLFVAGSLALLTAHSVIIYDVFVMNKESKLFIVTSLVLLIVLGYRLTLGFRKES